MNQYIKLALLFNGLFLLGNHRVGFSDFLQGLAFGLAIIFFSLGVYANHHDISTLRQRKRNLIRGLFLK